MNCKRWNRCWIRNPGSWLSKKKPSGKRNKHLKTTKSNGLKRSTPNTRPFARSRNRRWRKTLGPWPKRSTKLNEMWLTSSNSSMIPRIRRLMMGSWILCRAASHEASRDQHRKETKRPKTLKLNWSSSRHELQTWRSLMIFRSKKSHSSRNKPRRRMPNCKSQLMRFRSSKMPKVNWWRNWMSTRREIPTPTGSRSKTSFRPKKMKSMTTLRKINQWCLNFSLPTGVWWWALKGR